MTDLTNNAYVTAFPLATSTTDFTLHCRTLNLGTDGGPSGKAPYQGGTGIEGSWEWYPLGTKNNMDPSTSIIYDKGFGLSSVGALNKGWYSFRFHENGSLGNALGTAPEPSETYEPMNFGVLTGELSEPNAWNYATYTAGFAYGWSKTPTSNYGMGTTWNALNPNEATTYTLIMPEFSYSPGYYHLPAVGAGLSHKMVFTINTAWYQLKGGVLEGSGASEHLVGAYPHANLAVHQTFGIFLQRTNNNRLEFGYVCPGDLTWQAEQGTIDLGPAINHTPTNTVTNSPEAVSNGYDVKSDLRFIAGHDCFQVKTGYVLQIGINPARTHIAVRFNGEQIHTAALPTIIKDYFQNPPYDETTQTDLLLPAICDGTELYGNPEDRPNTPHMGVGFAMMTNLTKVYTGHYWTLNDTYDFGIFGLQKGAKNARNIVSLKPSPQRMNRLDDLNSSPGWANAGNQGEPPLVDRAALWQRNNPT